MSDLDNDNPADASADASADVSADAPADHSAFDFYVEQLETYLDGELQQGEADAVRQRLTQEPAYAAALDRLSQHREARMDLFAAPAGDDDAAAARLMAKTRSMVADDAALSAPLPASIANASVAGRIPETPSAGRGGIWWKVGLATAACMVIAFGAGFYGGWDYGTPPAAANPTPFVSNVSDASETTGFVTVLDPDDKEVNSMPVPEGHRVTFRGKDR